MNRLIAYLLLLLPMLAGAREIFPDSLAVVSVLTAGPGAEVYQLDGHTALRIRFGTDPQDDMTVNWGVFDFAAPNFIYRFVKGETDYMCYPVPTAVFAKEYVDEGRWLREQPVNLTPAQTARLVALVRDNIRPENRVYRYNYVKDNCSTRVLKVISASIEDDSTRVEIRYPDPGTSFRDEMRRNHRNYPWYQTGIDIALGNGIDYPLTAEENAFSPLYLQELLPNIFIVGDDGTERPLVGPTLDLLAQTAPEPREGGIPPLAAALALLAACVAAAFACRRLPRTVRCFYAAFYALLGIAGLVLTFLIFVSVHEATTVNANYLWANPLALIVPIFIWTKRGRNLVYFYQIANFALLVGYPIVAMAVKQYINPLFIIIVLANLVLCLNYIIRYHRVR